jgi:hypothetical protein
MGGLEQITVKLSSASSHNIDFSYKPQAESYTPTRSALRNTGQALRMSHECERGSSDPMS